MCSNFFFSENPTVYVIMWTNTVDRRRPQMTIWRMRIACWIPKATLPHTEVVQYSLLSTATMVARTRLSVTSYVHCLYCFITCTVLVFSQY